MEFTQCTFFAMAAGLLFVYFVVTLAWYFGTNQGQCNEADFSDKTRTMAQQVTRALDGTGNNIHYANWGDSHGVLSIGTAKATREAVEAKLNTNISPRTVSNAVCAGVSVESIQNFSNLFWLWGQFVDHTLGLTPTQEGPEAETMNIETVVEPGEDFPGRTIPFTRSVFRIVDGVRRTPTIISSYLDGTSVYGDALERAAALRIMDGTGKLKTGTADNGEVLMPKNVEGLSNANAGPTPADQLFLAGDIRANENAHLTAMHTLFVREHNRRCDELVVAEPELAGQDEMIYQRARRLTVGVLQAITFYEFLPLLLGTSLLTPYAGYQPDVNSALSIEFTTAAYRFGHTMVSENQPLGESGSDTVNLVNVFFNPGYVQQNGVDALLAGGARSKMQEVDGVLVDGLRNALFGPPTSQILHDLAAINMQRGRDHGLPSYTEALSQHGLPEPTTFAELNMSEENKLKLESVYGNVTEIDMWVGGIVERHDDEAALGPLFKKILAQEFLRVRDGDRFWFEHDPAFTSDDIALLKATKLGQVLTRNTGFTFSENAFIVR